VTLFSIHLNKQLMEREIHGDLANLSHMRAHFTHFGMTCDVCVELVSFILPFHETIIMHM
jgi:hypothetical protein